MERRQKIAILFNNSSANERAYDFLEDRENFVDQLNRRAEKNYKEVESKVSDQLEFDDEAKEMMTIDDKIEYYNNNDININNNISIDAVEASNEDKQRLRWLILGLSCFIMFGNFYAYDNPSALNRQLRTWMSDGSDGEFEYHLNLLYTVYSAPNIVLPFVVGRALDRFGSRHFLILLSLLMCFGQAIFSTGVSIRSWPWMLTGRFVFGLGGESLAVAQSRLVTEWFLGRELGLAIGLNLSVARIGTVFNNNASPRIASHSVAGACWVGLATCLFSLVCTFMCILIDSLKNVKEEEEDSNEMQAKESNLSIELESPSPLPTTKSLTTPTKMSNSSFNNSFINPTFYLLLFLNFLSYGAVLCFNTVASAYLQERYFKGNIFLSNWAMSIPDSTAIFMVPLMGFLVDHTGLKLGCIIVGQAALACGHFFLAVGSEKPYASLLVLGVGYSTLLAIWSCVPNLVGPGRQATAYGFLTASTNLSSTILPIIVATFVASDQSYLQVGLFFASLGIAGILVCIHVARLNYSSDLGLNSARVPSHMATSPFLHIKNDPKALKGPSPPPQNIFQPSKRNQVASFPIHKIKINTGYNKV